MFFYRLQIMRLVDKFKVEGGVGLIRWLLEAFFSGLKVAGYRLKVLPNVQLSTFNL